MITIGKWDVYKKGGHKETIRLKQVQKYYKKNSLKLLRKFWDTMDIHDAEAFVSNQYPDHRFFDLPWHMGLFSSKTEKRRKTKLRNQANKYLAVLKSLKKSGYAPDDFHSGHIKLKGGNVLVDGNHRYDLLFCRYGSEHQVEVWRVGFITATFVRIIFVFIMVTFVPLTFLTFIIRSLISFLGYPFYFLHRIYVGSQKKSGS